tara:strand:+ start:289 stop:774 length:486 start_codon:yes stop_codon:yes gene_type:complete
VRAKEKKMVKLNSVGSVVDTKDNMVYPILTTTGEADPTSTGVYLKDCCDEWFDSLSDEDRKIVNGLIITLELTNGEWETLKQVHLCHPIFPNKDGLLQVEDVDKFREFLHDEIKNNRDYDNGYVMNTPTLINLKSILQKLAMEYVKLNLSPMIGFDDKEVK